jgi:hypothetical protein
MRLLPTGRQVLIFVAITGWLLAIALAITVVRYLLWFGVMLIGIVVLLAAQGAEMEPASSSPHLLRRRYEQTFGDSGDARLKRWAELWARDRWLYIVRTIGIALALLGLNMFIEHQIWG